MANPIWLTGQGQRLVNLGTVTEGSYFEYTLDAYDPKGGPVSYKFLAGELPPGIRINSNSAVSTGFIQGGPYLNTVANKTASYDFTVRATDQNGLVSDKSFELTIANINPPVIITPVNLGQVFDGSYYNLQLEATELNPYAKLTWSILSGSLPSGLSLTTDGLINGFIMPLPTISNTGLQGFNATPFNEFGYENNAKYQNDTYKFTVSVFDGANEAQLTYVLRVAAKDLFTADSTFNTVDNTYLTVDHDNIYTPIMTTPSQTLPQVRSNSKFAFQFQAVDPNGATLVYALGLSSSGAAGFDQGSLDTQSNAGIYIPGTTNWKWTVTNAGAYGTVPGIGFDTIGFDQENLTVPPGLTLSNSSGWLSGTVGSQPQALQTYTFQVYAYEGVNPSLQSKPVTYTMDILGDITNTVTWTTGANLGIIDNGTVSQFAVSAVNNAGKPLVYSLASDSSLPQGLQLNRDGLIVGRTGFEFFSLDGGTTTIDTVVSDFDNTYKFTIVATTTDGTASNQKSFNILVNNFNKTPYENVYIKALPSIDQRKVFLDIVNNNDIFPESLLYRPSDLNFGRARDIRSLFLAGLNPTEVDSYLSAMNTNTYRKRVDFGKVKTAIAVDENFNTKYEVVYLELEHDFAYNTTTNSTRVYDKITGKYVYNNSYANMSKVLSNSIGFANIGALPEWMTGPQADKKQLGFTRAVVLAYTVPGASNLIAYRLNATGLSFNDIDFMVDRYDLDNSYTANYEIASKTFNAGKETTFDRIQRNTTVTASATYGVSGIAFDQINRRTVSQVNAVGGLDGITKFKNGETLVFLQQENFGSAVGSYDGWTDNGKIVVGWNEFNNSIKYSSTDSGFPANPQVGQVTKVNGTYYMFVTDLDSNGNVIARVWKIANLRANIWTINIDSNNLVTLTPATFLRQVGIGVNRSTINSMIMASDVVQINQGNSHSESLIFYNPSLQIGQSVPAYTPIRTFLASTNKSTNTNNNTRFDEYGTRFIDNRISYEYPEVGDTWLIFPNDGPLL